MLKIFTLIMKIALVLIAIFWISNAIDKKTVPQQEMEHDKVQ